MKIIFVSPRLFIFLMLAFDACSATAQSSSPDANKCIQIANFDGESDFRIKNICNYPINITYSFSKSKPFAGGYSTLRPNEKTFESCGSDETIDGWACKAPGVPQTLHGGCL
ncbi:hypothetical protein ACFSHT_28800 [Paraburkholderia silviterrae]|uniref:Uncharacterized protein n=1 Tax=Paraburkholderia silviterrae TaxID=2528715 RepID=A0A4R5M5L6_9BURK|nr:hypothetical protein [Paraburkholderia silviterrae]TDG21171.1 hypothetical protein EYW47_22665 [Paraburkholderia silviterrae]